MAGRRIGVLGTASVLLLLGLPTAASTAGAASPPAPVRDLAAFQLHRPVTLDWTNPRGIDRDVVRIARGPNAPSTPTGGRGVALNSPTATHAVLANLARGTVYSVAVWTRGAGGLSRRATTTFTTHARPAALANITGIVTDPAGHALAGVRIVTFSLGTHFVRTTTDRRGMFRIGEPAGRYYLDVSGANATGGSSDATGYQSKPVVVVLHPGQQMRSVHITLPPGGVLHGAVTDAGGNPLRGVAVTMLPPLPYLEQDGVSAGAFFSEVGSSPRTGPKGRYTVRGVGDQALVPCFDPSHGSARARSYVARCATGSAAVAPGHSVRVPVVTLARSAGGRVQGTVTDTRGHAVPNVVVALEPSSYQQGQPREIVADPRGRYAFGGLHAGRWRLCASAIFAQTKGLGLLPKCQSVVVDVTKPVRADLALAPGGALSGVVRGPSGAGVAGVSVNVNSVTPSNQPSSFGFAPTDSRGAYTVSGLGTGTYQVCFTSDGTADPRNPTGVAPGCLHRHITVTAGRDRLGGDDTLSAGGAVTGVVRGSDGAPLPGASSSVSLDSRRAFGSAVPGADGHYLASGLKPASYRVCAGTYDFTDGRQACLAHRVTVTAGHTVRHVDLRLPKPTAIRARVVDAAGHPLDGVDVVALGSCATGNCRVEPVFGNRPVRVASTVMTNASGVARMYGLHAGHYAVCALGYYAATPADRVPTGYGDKCSGSTFTVSVTRGSTTPLTVQLDPGGAVTGRVTDQAGHPLRHVRIDLAGSATGDIAPPEPGTQSFGSSAQFPLPTPYADVYTDATGRYTIHSVRAGQRKLCVRAGSAQGGSSSTGYRNACLAGPVTVTGGDVTNAPTLALAARPAAATHASRAARPAATTPARTSQRLVLFAGRWYTDGPLAQAVR